MGQTHVKNVIDGKCPDFELTAVADLKPARLDWVKEISANTKLFENAESMLASGLVEACMVCVPHYDHAKYAIACMKRNIHVMESIAIPDSVTKIEDSAFWYCANRIFKCSKDSSAHKYAEKRYPINNQ